MQYHLDIIAYTGLSWKYQCITSQITLTDAALHNMISMLLVTSG